MYNPSMFEQARKNMNKDQMKQAAEMMSKMSDAELLNYAKMSGMPINDVNMLRTQANMMKNMDDSQFETFKNMVTSQLTVLKLKAQNMNYPGYGQPSTATPSTQQATPQATSDEYKPLEKLKQKGNDHFKQGKYQEACTTYTECLLEIEEIRAKERTTNKSELDNIEISVRMNLANAKAKLEDFDAVLTQAKTVLKMGENGKAYFRAGQALHHFGKNRAALDHLEKAKKLLNDDTVTELYNKVKVALGQEPVESTKDESEPSSQVNEDSQENTEKSQKKSKMTKKNVEEGGKSTFTPPVNTSSKPKETLRETKIEEEKYEPKPTTTSTPTYPNPAGFPSGSDGINPDNIKKSQEQLKNMDPEQLKTMTDTFKTMDNSFIRQMMKSQTGMDMSDEDIQRMKSFMTPDMLKNMSNMDPSQIQNMQNMKRNMPSSTASSTGGSKTGSSGSTGAQPSAQPNINDMMGGGMPTISGDMVKNMLEMMSSNPEMLRSMANMLGDNPVANKLKNMSTEDLKKLVVWIKRASKVVFFFSPVYRLIKNYWQLILGCLVGYILYVMFGN